jgi:hypothetical protein
MAYLGKTPSQAVRSRYYFTASGGETSLAPAQVTGLSFTDANYVDVSLNGVALVSGTDYTATPSTNTISSLAALTASDVVEIVVYDTFSVFGGSVNGDFTISNGTLAAEAVTVTGLTTTGNINFGDNDKAIFGAGSDLQIYHSGNDSYVLDSGTGDLYLAGENNVRITSNTGLEAMATLTANGAVTLFHDNAAKLATTSTGIDVTGTVTADGLTVETASGGATAEIVSGGGTSSLFMGDPSDRDSGSITYANASDSMQFVTNASERLRITSAGSVGISTTSPTKKISASIGLNDTDGLALEYNGENRGGILLNPIGGEVRMGAQNSTGTYFTTLYSNGSERVRVDQSGNVGIGTTSITTGTLGSSNRFLEVSAGTANGSGTLVLSRNTSANNLEIGGRSVTTDSNAGDDSGGVLVFNTKPETGTLAERMRITSSGDVEITGGYASSQTFQSTGALRVSSNSNSATANVALELMNDAGSARTLATFTNLNGVVGSISTNGSATSYNESSDYRLKENVVAMTGAIDRVKALAPKRFNFIVDPDTTVDGFLAHEAQAVVPEAVTGTHNEVDGDGNAVMQGIDKGKLVPLLTGALQEAIAKIETLETQRADLEARLTALENAE